MFDIIPVTSWGEGDFRFGPLVIVTAVGASRCCLVLAGGEIRKDGSLGEQGAVLSIFFFFGGMLLHQFHEPCISGTTERNREGELLLLSYWSR